MGDLKHFLYEYCIPFLLCLCLFAAILNIAVFLSRFSVKARTSTLELTYSLALSDTFSSIVIAISLFWNSYKPVVLGHGHSSYCFPLTLEAFRTGGLLTGVFHLTALSYAHFIQIRRPFDHQKILPIRRVQMLIVMMWTLPPVSLIIYFAMWQGQGYRHPACLGISFYENILFRANISIVIIVLIIITSFLYLQMLATLREVRSKASATATGRGRRTVVTAVLIFGTFLFGWCPASILFFLTARGMPLYQMNNWIIHILSIVVLLNIMLKTLTNPIIYATRIPEIRHFVLHKLLWRIVPFRTEEANKKNGVMLLRPPQPTASFTSL